MKAKHFVFSMLLGAALLSSCSDDENVAGGGESTEPKGDTPTVAMDFDYATSRSIEVGIKSPVSTVVSVYSDKDCTANGLLVEDLPISNEVKNLNLSIPVGCDKLYVEYPTANGTKKASFDITSALTRATTEFILPEDAVAVTSEEDAGFTFYHNTGVAMFEDEWPEIVRDNDYNDVVLEYDLKVTECNKESIFAEQAWREGLLLTLDIRAIGGRYPTQVGLELGGLDKKFIKTIEARLLKKAGQGIQYSFDVKHILNKQGVIEHLEADGEGHLYRLYIDTTSDKLVIYLDGLKNLSGNNNYYQVYPNHIYEGEPMVRAEIMLQGDLRTSLSDKQEQLLAYRNMIKDTKNQNFFIRTANEYGGREIHLAGYEPTYSYTKYSKDAGEWANEPIKYCGTDNFTWGLKLPAGTRHIQEAVDINDAYPEYAKWVSSKGAENKDWYLHPDMEKVIKYW